MVKEMTEAEQRILFWIMLVGLLNVAHAVFAIFKHFNRPDTTTINGLQRELVRRVMEQHGSIGLHSHGYTVTDGENKIRVTVSLKQESEETP